RTRAALRDVAHARRGAADGGGRDERTRVRATRSGRAVRGARVARLARVDGAVAAPALVGDDGGCPVLRAGRLVGGLAADRADDLVLGVDGDVARRAARVA